MDSKSNVYSQNLVLNEQETKILEELQVKDTNKQRISSKKEWQELVDMQQSDKLKQIYRENNFQYYQSVETENTGDNNNFYRAIGFNYFYNILIDYKSNKMYQKQLNDILEELDPDNLNIRVCKIDTIPENLRSVYESENINYYLRTGLKYAVIQEDNEKINQILTDFMNYNDYFDLSLIMYMRSKTVRGFNMYKFHQNVRIMPQDQNGVLQNIKNFNSILDQQLGKLLYIILDIEANTFGIFGESQMSMKFKSTDVTSKNMDIMVLNHFLIQPDTYQICYTESKQGKQQETLNSSQKKKTLSYLAENQEEQEQKNKEISENQKIQDQIEMENLENEIKKKQLQADIDKALADSDDSDYEKKAQDKYKKQQEKWGDLHTAEYNEMMQNERQKTQSDQDEYGDDDFENEEQEKINKKKKDQKSSSFQEIEMEDDEDFVEEKQKQNKEIQQNQQQKKQLQEDNLNIQNNNNSNNNQYKINLNQDGYVNNSQQQSQMSSNQYQQQSYMSDNQQSSVSNQQLISLEKLNEKYKQENINLIKNQQQNKQNIEKLQQEIKVKQNVCQNFEDSLKTQKEENLKLKKQMEEQKLNYEKIIREKENNYLKSAQILQKQINQQEQLSSEQINKLQENVQNKDKESKDFKNNFQSLEQKLTTELKEIKEQKDFEIQQLKEQVEQLNLEKTKEYKQQKVSREKLDFLNQIEQLQEQINQQNDRIKELDTMLREKSEQIKKYKEIMKLANEELCRKDDQIEELKEITYETTDLDVEELDQRLDDKCKEKAKLRVLQRSKEEKQREENHKLTKSLFRHIRQIIKNQNITNKMVFDIIDHDKDEKISILDLKYFFKKLDQGKKTEDQKLFKYKDARSIMELVDRDQDNCLNFEEFQKALNY